MMDTSKMREQAREMFEKNWIHSNEEQGLHYIQALGVYGCDLSVNQNMADLKSSAWYHYWLGWQKSREDLVIQLPELIEFAEKGGDYLDGARNGYNQCIDACAASLKFAGLRVAP